MLTMYRYISYFIFQSVPRRRGYKEERVQGGGATRRRDYKEEGLQGGGATRRRGYKEEGLQGGGTTRRRHYINNHTHWHLLPHNTLTCPLKVLFLLPLSCMK